MRIIGGSARGKRLLSFKNNAIRPTSDFVREALFNIIKDQVMGSRFLDLYAGTGAVGIEALSRGAEHAVFVEQDIQARKLIQQNLTTCKLSERATLLPLPVTVACKHLVAGQTFTIIFIDPPYRKGIALETIYLLEPLNLLATQGMLIVQTDKRDSLAPDYNKLHRYSDRAYGDTRLHFYRYGTTR